MDNKKIWKFVKIREVWAGFGDLFWHYDPFYCRIMRAFLIEEVKIVKRVMNTKKNWENINWFEPKLCKNKKDLLKEACVDNFVLFVLRNV